MCKALLGASRIKQRRRQERSPPCGAGAGVGVVWGEACAVLSDRVSLGKEKL